MRAASAITDASNIIFFIYSSLFLCLFRDPGLGSGRASSRPPAPRPENSSLLFWVPSLGLLPCARFIGGLAEEASAVRKTRTALRVALWDACVLAQKRRI